MTESSELYRGNLFRGKHTNALPQNEHLNGKWVYGYLCNKNCIFSPELEGELLVDPETICRCTGKTDQNARDIFEKDICIIHSTSIDEEDGLFVVEWNSDSAKFELSGWGIMTDFENQNGYECEIIGNICDNPELLKGEAYGMHDM